VCSTLLQWIPDFARVNALLHSRLLLQLIENVRVWLVCHDLSAALMGRRANYQLNPVRQLMVREIRRIRAAKESASVVWCNSGRSPTTRRFLRSPKLFIALSSYYNLAASGLCSHKITRNSGYIAQYHVDVLDERFSCAYFQFLEPLHIILALFYFLPLGCGPLSEFTAFAFYMAVLCRRASYHSLYGQIFGSWFGKIVNSEMYSQNRETIIGV